MDGEREYPRIPLRANPGGQGILLVALGMLALGVVMVFSASISVGGNRAWYARDEFRHLIYVAMAATIMLLLWRMDYHVLMRGKRFPTSAGIIVLLSLALVVAATLFGPEINGAHRWLRLGPKEGGISFQPSELLKLSLVVFLAGWLGREEMNLRKLRKLVPVVMVIGICIATVAKEDLGTAAVIGGACFTVLILAGLPWYYVAALIPPAAAGFCLFVWMEPYRWARIMAFLHPTSTQTHATYQPHQAMIAIGSGGLWGKGLANGTMKLGFLPEDNTDYIFSIICEELGFVGAAMVLAMVATLLYLSWRATDRAADKPGKLLAGGLGLLIAIQSIGHIAVNLSAVPPKGMGLPLISAGGSGLVLVAIAVSLIVSVTARSEGS